MLIECESDDLEFREKFLLLASQVLAETHSTGITGIRMMANIEKGYVIISANLKKKTASSPLSRYAELKHVDDGVMVSINDESESKLPIIIRTIRNKYGTGLVREESRFVVHVIGIAEGDLSELMIDEDEPMIGNVIQTLSTLSPEGFRIGSTMRNFHRITMMWSEYPAESDWMEQMKLIHNQNR